MAFRKPSHQWFFSSRVSLFSADSRYFHETWKAGYTLIISRVSTCSCTILWTTLWDCEPITIDFSQYHRFHSSLILRETWRETFPIFSLTFRENTDCLARMAKCEMRKIIGKMVYECLLYTYRFSHFANIFLRSRQFYDKCMAKEEMGKVSITFLTESKMNEIGDIVRSL